MSVFEDLFTQARKETVNDKILQKLEEIKQLMVPKVIYVPIYIEQKPWWYCEPLDITFPETFKTYYGIDFGMDEHACLGAYSVST